MINKVNVSVVGQNSQQRANAVSYKATTIQNARTLLGLQNRKGGIEKALLRLSKKEMTPELESRISALTQQKATLETKIKPLEATINKAMGIVPSPFSALA